MNEEARQVYVESGFNDYVDSKMKRLPESRDKKRIICGVKNDSVASKDLCDFVIMSLGKSRRDIQPIQKVLIELPKKNWAPIFSIPSLLTASDSIV